jgi:hypothetical protein
MPPPLPPWPSYRRMEKNENIVFLQWLLRKIQQYGAGVPLI